jgi:N6-L-threonylcarbamoyladenine synthase
VLNLVKKLDGQALPVNDIAASAQAAIVDMLVAKTALAVEEYDAKMVLLAGGVAANKALREEMTARASRPVFYPPPKLCVDNGAMIGAAAWRHFRRGERSEWDLDVVPNLKLV